MILWNNHPQLSFGVPHLDGDAHLPLSFISCHRHMRESQIHSEGIGSNVEEVLLTLTDQQATPSAQARAGSWR